MSDQPQQSHPLKIYFWVWGWLFVLSTLSYLTDLSPLEGPSKWFFISLFMLMKAGLIMAVFMHLQWERLSLATVIIVFPGALVFAMVVFGFEGDYIVGVREQFFANLNFYRSVH
jgi:cytochrome c oxidase subunit IV